MGGSLDYYTEFEAGTDDLKTSLSINKKRKSWRITNSKVKRVINSESG